MVWLGGVSAGGAKVRLESFLVKQNTFQPEFLAIDVELLANSRSSFLPGHVIS
jgi:hypothetical protein